MPDERLFVRGDRARLAQALVAPDHQRRQVHASSRARSSISVRRAARTVQISVKDEGEGIDPKFLPHAFELFAQQDQTLARARSAASASASRWRAASPSCTAATSRASAKGPGRGSEFVLWLPLLEADEVGGEASSRRCRALTESYRVLIVEDDADTLESLRLQMELWGTEVSTARSAEEALDVAERLPAADRAVRHRPARDGRLSPGRAAAPNAAGRPVVFAAVTGYASAEDQQRALDAGFDSFFVKPLNPGSLAHLLRAYSERGRPERPRRRSAHFVERARLAEPDRRRRRRIPSAGCRASSG